MPAVNAKRLAQARATYQACLAELRSERPKKPLSLELTKFADPEVLGPNDLFPSEDLADAGPELAPSSDCYHVFYRTANHFTFFKSGTRQMVAPKAYEADITDKGEYDLLAFISPLTDGARRASAALAGHFPLYEGVSHPDLWQSQTVLRLTKVRTPYFGSISFFGCNIPCVVVPNHGPPSFELALLNPDPSFRPYWEVTRARYGILAAQGKNLNLPEWHDVDPAEPRPWWMNRWAMTMIRLERKLTPHIDGDPDRPAMLGLCRNLDGPERRAPVTEREWELISVEDCDFGDDEADVSDAGSIDDDPESGVPTCHDWDPTTKRSRSARGPTPMPSEGSETGQTPAGAQASAKSAGKRKSTGKRKAPGKRKAAGTRKTAGPSQGSPRRGQAQPSEDPDSGGGGQGPEELGPSGETGMDVDPRPEDSEQTRREPSSSSATPGQSTSGPGLRFGIAHPTGSTSMGPPVLPPGRRVNTEPPSPSIPPPGVSSRRNHHRGGPGAGRGREESHEPME